MFPDIFPETVASIFFSGERSFMPVDCIPRFRPFKTSSAGVNEKSENMMTNCRSAFARSSGVQIINGAERTPASEGRNANASSKCRFV